MPKTAAPSTPDDPEFAKAAALQHARDYAAAAKVWTRLANKALTLNIAINLGICLQETGRLGQALHYFTIVLRHRPDEPEVRRLRGNTYALMDRIPEAEADYRAGLAANPGHHRLQLALAGLLLSDGRYREGWPLLESRVPLNPDVVPPVEVSFPEWRGQDLAGRSILVWYEQGFGDQIMFVRFARELKARGAAHVAMGCRPALVDLFKTAAGVDEVIPAPKGETIAIRDYDFWSRYFSLPEHLGITLETLPGEPYLSAPPDRRARWAGWSGVGFVWRASPTGFNAGNKNVPDKVAQRLLDLGARSLHPEDTGAQDFADTAAIIEQLDLVISIDTSVAHLAGAMGKPCWTLLPRLHVDWRWGRTGAESAWYPSMRLYRQQTAQDWTGVMDQIVRDLVGILPAASS